MTEVNAPPATIVEFLTARLDEDEAEVTRPEPRPFADADYSRGAHEWHCAALIESGNGTHDLDCDCGEPARRRADIAAKRALLPLAQEAEGVEDSLFMEFATGPKTQPFVGEKILRAMATPYSDHPDYRQEWKP